MQSIAMADMTLNDRMKEFIEHEKQSWLMEELWFRVQG